MKIAIIGGGASGMISAYLLQHQHEIHVFEKKSILGGHIQTLNGNVHDTSLSKDVIIENGVLGFHKEYYPKFHKLMDRLNISLHEFNPSISFLSNRRFYPSKKNHLLEFDVLKNVFSKPSYLKELIQLRKCKKDFFKRAHNYKYNEKDLDPISNLLGTNKMYANYILSLLMLSFSTPFEQTARLPNSLTLPYLKELPGSTWSFIKPGVYHYIQQILELFRGTIRLNSQIKSIVRTEINVSILLANGEQEQFDKVIFATPPGVILNLIQDATPIEQEIFKNWFDIDFKTTAHSDIELYSKFKTAHKTPMDLFYQFQDESIGYNTFMNEVYQLDNSIPYSFSYNLESLLDQSKILHTADHKIPDYTKCSYATKNLIKDLCGQNHTYFVGAYLGNGLHEGAVSSALEVSNQLGGIQF